MSLTVGELQVLLSGDPSKLNRELDRIDNRAGQTERTHSAAWGRIGAMAGAAIKAGMVVATGAVIGLGAAIKQGLNMASFTEQAEISFGTLLGSAEAAKTYLGDLQKFAAATPFELPGVVHASRQLLGVGQAAETVIPTLTAWGDTAGALGLSQEQFGRVMTATTQSMAKGKIQAEELMQITEAGIPIYKLLSDALGLPVPEIQKLASEGKLLAEDVFPLLEKQMQKDYGGSMAKQAGTLSGLWSTAKDSMNLALKDAVLPLAAGLKTVLPSASAAAGDAIREMGLRMSEGLVNLIERGQELHKTYGPEMAALGDLAAQKWGQFVDLLRELGAQVAPSLPSLVDSLLRIAQVGAEVGEAMLPVLNAGLQAAGPLAQAVAGSLGIVADVLEAIEPVLPVVVGGFLAFKGMSAVVGIWGSMAGALGGLNGRLKTMAQEAAFATYNVDGLAGKASGRLSGALGTAAGAVSKVGAALPILGIAVGVVGMAIERGERQLDGWAQALLDGGAAAKAAREEMQETADAANEWVDITKGKAWVNFTGAGVVMQANATAAGEAARLASERSRELEEAMSPLEKAEQDVTTATNNLAFAQEEHGAGSRQAAVASGVLESAQRALEIKQQNLENATRGATGALMEQAQQAIANANAELGFQSSLMGTQQAITDYTTGIQDGSIAAEQRAQRETQLAQQINNTVMAAGAAAAETHKNSSEAERNAAVVAAQRDAFNQLTGQLGYVPAALQQVGTDLNKAGVAAGSTAEQMEALGLSVLAIPGNKTVFIEAPTAEQKQRLQDLGLTVRTLPNGRIYVTADTSPAEGTLAWFMNQRRTIQLEAIITGGGPRTALGGLGGGGGVQARAGGGPVGARTPYIVGEEGQELFVPDVPGTIIDAKKTAAMLAAAGNRHAAAMLPALGGGIGGRSMSLTGGSAANGSASVGGVTEKHYHMHAAVTRTITLPEFMRLQKEADALYG